MIDDLKLRIDLPYCLDNGCLGFLCRQRNRGRRDGEIAHAGSAHVANARELARKDLAVVAKRDRRLSGLVKLKVDAQQVHGARAAKDGAASGAAGLRKHKGGNAKPRGRFVHGGAVVAVDGAAALDGAGTITGAPIERESGHSTEPKQRWGEVTNPQSINLSLSLCLI